MLKNQPFPEQSAEFARLVTQIRLHGQVPQQPPLHTDDGLKQQTPAAGQPSDDLRQFCETHEI